MKILFQTAQYMATVSTYTFNEQISSFTENHSYLSTAISSVWMLVFTISLTAGTYQCRLRAVMHARILVMIGIAIVVIIRIAICVVIIIYRMVAEFVVRTRWKAFT